MMNPSAPRASAFKATLISPATLALLALP